MNYIDRAIAKYADLVAPIGLEVVRCDALLILDGTPCNKKRGWYGTKPGCERKKSRGGKKSPPKPKKLKPKTPKSPAKKKVGPSDTASKIDALVSAQVKATALLKEARIAADSGATPAERMRGTEQLRKHAATIANFDADLTRAVEAHVEATKTKPETTRKHGMLAYEPMWSFELAGVKFHGSGAVSGSAAVETAKNLAAAKAQFPEKLRNAVTDIYHSGGASKDDQYWQKVYGDGFPGSAATGGDGEIVSYSGRSMSIGTIAHEMGHSLAQKAYGGSYSPTARSAFAKAVNSGEAPVSEYAKVSISEDFAESIGAYVTNPEALKANQPKRYSALRRLLM